MESPINYYQISLKLFLKNSEGQLLVMSTPVEWGQGGKFDVPGGRINEDEANTPFETILRRELNEELGNDVIVDISAQPVAIGQYKIPLVNVRAADNGKPNQDVHILYVFYEGIYNGGDITLDEDHTGWEWIDPKDPKYADKFLSGMYQGLLNLK